MAIARPDYLFAESFGRGGCEMNWAMSLFILCSLAGLVMVTGSLALLWKGRIYLDAKGKVSHVQLPIGIKLSTHAPVLVMFLFGVFLLVFPVYYDKNICPDLSLHAKSFPEMVDVTAPVKSSKPVDIYAIVAERPKIQSEVTFSVPWGKNFQYRVMYGDSNGNYSLSDPFSLGDKPVSKLLRAIEVQAPTTSVPEIAQENKASPEKVAEFK
jgi:hypothetical protein